MSYITKYLIALLFTIGTETLILFVLTKFAFRFKDLAPSNVKVIITGIFASSATLPHLWFVLPALIKNRIIFGTVGELGVFAIEGLFYYFFLFKDWKKAYVSSFVCNLVSFLLGLLIF